MLASLYDTTDKSENYCSPMLAQPQNYFQKCVYHVQLHFFCGYTVVIIVLLFFFFVNRIFSAFDASLSTILNFGACTTVSNVSYNVSYARKMYVSLLDLIGSTKILFESYAYNISICFIPQYLVNGKRPVISLYTFTLSGSDRKIAANTYFLVYSLGGKNSVSRSNHPTPGPTLTILVLHLNKDLMSENFTSLQILI